MLHFPYLHTYSMMSISRFLSVPLTVLLLHAAPRTCIGHVQLSYPPSIIDDDYQYTFDGTCQGKSCDAFCGITGPSRPLTTVSPGPLDITLDVNVKHPPYMYRISFSSNLGGDENKPGGFDTYILADDIPNPNDGTKRFNVTVDIPDVTCDPYCTLQLYDYYYFVSCANILVDNGSGEKSLEEGDEGDDNELGGEDESTTSGGNVSGGDGEISFRQEAANDGASVMISVAVTLPSESWLAVGVSPSGGMIGSRAVIGLPAGQEATTTTTSEWDLNGKFTEAFVAVPNEKLLSLSSSFDIAEKDDERYEHRLSAILPLQACGMSLIWAHANAAGGMPTDILGYHGENKGLLGIIECPDVEADVTSNSTSTSAVGQMKSNTIALTSTASPTRGSKVAFLTYTLQFLIGVGSAIGYIYM